MFDQNLDLVEISHCPICGLPFYGLSNEAVRLRVHKGCYWVMLMVLLSAILPLIVEDHGWIYDFFEIYHRSHVQSANSGLDESWDDSLREPSGCATMHLRWLTFTMVSLAAISIGGAS